MLETYPVSLPKTAFSALRKTPTEFVQEMKYAAVVKWYEAEMIGSTKRLLVNFTPPSLPFGHLPQNGGEFPLSRFGRGTT
ncbi:MAG: hypothetical protein DRI32_09115 [Chloroflexi bacterium]|nr:MAG: hypothetical protein DRI32_09115 [Chloroflexota bacterium]